MDENKNASIAINLGDGSITISGTEDFVEKNMDRVFNFVEKNRKLVQTEEPKVLPSKEPAVLSTVEQPKATALPHEKETDKYITAGVYHIDAEDGTISILKKIPGSNKAEKAKNIALIVLYIKKGKIEGKELVPICEKHACYDGSNFSKTFNNEKTNIVRKGSRQSWTIELTQPGETAAVALLEEMANDKK